MSDLKSFSVGHTAKGAVWWQAWPFDGEPRKGTADTIGDALAQVGVVADSPAVVPDADNLRARYESACHRENQAFQRIGELQAINGEQARTIADLMADLDACQAENKRLGVKVSAMVGAIDRLEAALPDTYDPAPDAPAKGPASPAKARKVAKGPDAPAYPADGPEAAADPVGEYIAGVRRG